MRTLVLIVALLVAAGCSKTELPEHWGKSPGEFDAPLRNFFAAKEKQARELQKTEQKEPLPEVWQYFKAASNGDWKKVTRLFCWRYRYRQAFSLHQRAGKVRQSLISSGNRMLKVLPIKITTKTRAEVQTQLEQAHKRGIWVATKIAVPRELFSCKVLFPDPTQLYAEAEGHLPAVSRNSFTFRSPARD